MAKKAPNAVGSGADEKEREKDRADKAKNENKAAIANYRAVVRALGTRIGRSRRALSFRSPCSPWWPPIDSLDRRPLERQRQAFALMALTFVAFAPQTLAGSRHRR